MAVEAAMKKARVQGLDNVRLETVNAAENLADSLKKQSVDLILCSEVLEHLDEPEKTLNQICNAKYFLASVPNEPIWSILNMCRGKYLRDFGNTPGHVKKWSTLKFERMLSKYFTVLYTWKCLPWSICLCEIKNKDVF